MLTNKLHRGIDGTKVLEKLAAHVIKCYLGSRAESIVFGTAKSGGFQEKVRFLCNSLNEGAGFRQLDRDSDINANDDKLDTVAWIPFSDKLSGQLIIFGQCKTGSSSDGLESQLQPVSFAKRWFIEPFLVDPLRAFFVSESMDHKFWKSFSVSAGIVFDRCRIVDFCDNFEIAETNLWTETAFKSFNIGDLRETPDP